MGVEDSRVYLSRQINNIYKIFGDNITIRGLDVIASYSGSIVQFDISSGTAVVDTTLLEFGDPTTLTLDINGLPENNTKLVVNISYKYIQTLQANKPYFKASWVSDDGNSQLPNSWQVNRDLLVLAWFEFTTDGSNNVTSLTPHILPSDIIVIDGVTYYPGKGIDIDSYKPGDISTICSIEMDCSNFPTDQAVLAYNATTNRVEFSGEAGSGSRAFTIFTSSF